MYIYITYRDVVAHANAQGAAGSALADHQGDDGHLQPRHRGQIGGDGLRLAVALTVEGWPGSNGVHEGDHRQVEALGELHQTQRSAVSVRRRHSVVRRLHVRGSVSFVGRNHYTCSAVERSKTAS
jgi:hypothetical protein